MEYASLLQRFTDGCINIFGKNLTGVYLHGSLAMGCFHPSKSDIDLLVVSRTAASHEEKRRLLDLCVDLNDEAPAKGIEMSLVRLEDCLCPIHPIHFDLHFSPGHLERYRRNAEEYVLHMNGDDPDLAAHFTITRARGVCICGKPIKDVFGDVPREAYLSSILFDIADADEDIIIHPLYVTLNLCRICAFVEEGLIQSKREGGLWALKRIPEYASYLRNALASYAGDEPFTPDQDTALSFCHTVRSRIDDALRK